MQSNESNTKNHSSKFLKSTILILFIFNAAYFVARYFMGLDDSRGMATYLTGILGAAVGLAGAWVAIIIAEIATRAQVQANKYDNPYYQKANVIISAAKDFVATFEFLVASAQDMRRRSFAEGRANIVNLTSACAGIQKNLEHQLMATGLYGLLCQLEYYYHKREATPQLVQNIIGLIGELSRVEKTTDLTNKEVESLMTKYVLATLNLNYLAKLVEKVPNVEALTELLESNASFSEKYVKEHGIKITGSIRAECKSRNEEIVDQIYINHELSSTEESVLQEMFVRKIIRGMVDKIDIKSIDETGYFKSLPDLDIFKEAIFFARQKCFPKMNSENRIARGITPIRSALVDFGTYRADDLFKAVCDSVSLNIFGDKRECIVVRSLNDLADHLTDDGKVLLDIISCSCRDIKRFVKKYDEKGFNQELNSEKNGNDEQSVNKKRELEDLIVQAKERYNLIDQNLPDFIKAISSLSSNLFIIELNDDCDFYVKVKLANSLPYSVLHWCYFPYLPSPGFQPKKFFRDGLLESSGIDNMPSHFSSIRTLTPLIATGSMFVINNDGPDKSEDIGGYARHFSEKYVAVRNGEL